MDEGQTAPMPDGDLRCVTCGHRRDAHEAGCGRCSACEAPACGDFRAPTAMPVEGSWLCPHRRMRWGVCVECGDEERARRSSQAATPERLAEIRERIAGADDGADTWSGRCRALLAALDARDAEIARLTRERDEARTDRDAAVAAERERCAAICEAEAERLRASAALADAHEVSDRYAESDGAERCARRIRAPGTPAAEPEGGR
jgi:hypothetical protein